MGWKRIRNEKNNEQIFVVASNIYDSVNSWSVGISKNIITKTNVIGKEIDYRLFKTKTDAIRFANNYMSSH